MILLQTAFRSLVPILCLTALGCGQSDYAAVEGVVIYEGKPVSNATVIFSPASGGAMAVGETGSDGRFELVTQGSQRIPGAKIGLSKVSVNAVDLEASSQSPADGDLGSLAMLGGKAPKLKSRLPVKYSSFETSGLSFDVEAGKKNLADFELTD